MFWLDGNAKVIIKQTYYKLIWKEFFTSSLLVVLYAARVKVMV